MQSAGIAFFGSSQAIANLVLSASKDIRYPLHSYIAPLEQSVQKAIECIERDHIEVIVSLRGTADILRKGIDIPVLSLPCNSANLFSALHKAAKVSDAIFLPRYKDESFDLHFFESILHTKIHSAYYADSFSLQSIMEEVSLIKNIAVVGGGTTCDIAQKLGLVSYLVLPSIEEVRLTLDNAENVLQARLQEKDLLNRYTALLDTVAEGIFLVSPNKKIAMANKKAQSFLARSGGIIGRTITDFIPEDSLIPQEGVVQKIQDTPFFISSTLLGTPPGSEGTLYSFQPAQNVMQAGKQVHKAISNGHVAKYTTNDFIHASEKTHQILEQAKIFAKSDSTVLITGESGTGKEIIAHAIHNASPRKNNPFVSVNCAAIPEQLLESELFGYEGGAFTGSKSEGKIGLFELADHGTLFLDEINSMPMSVQVLLLRALQEREIRRVGGSIVIPLDVRIVAATNKSLIQEVQAGRIREDLFYRLNVLTLTMPPLRERKEDIPSLVNFFLHNTRGAKGGFSHFQLPDTCLNKLCDIQWKGNTRELKHFIERLVLLSNGKFTQSIFDTVFSEAQQNSQILMVTQHDTEQQDGKGNITKEEIEAALTRAQGKKALAAKILGVSRTTLWRLMSNYKL